MRTTAATCSRGMRSTVSCTEREGGGCSSRCRGCQWYFSSGLHAPAVLRVERAYTLGAKGIRARESEWKQGARTKEGVRKEKQDEKITPRIEQNFPSDMITKVIVHGLKYCTERVLRWRYVFLTGHCGFDKSPQIRPAGASEEYSKILHHPCSGATQANRSVEGDSQTVAQRRILLYVYTRRQFPGSLSLRKSARHFAWTRSRDVVECGH